MPLSNPKKLLFAATALTLLSATAFLPFRTAQAQTQSPEMPSVAAPIKAGGIVALDLPDSSAQTISLDIVKGRFSDYSVGRITLTGSGIDFRNGTLQGLKADITEGNFDNLLVDSLRLNAPAFQFDTMQLINNRTFILAQPVTAKVDLNVSEAALNRFITSPKTLNKIEKAIQKKTGGLKLITFASPNLDLMGGDKVKLSVMTILAQGMAVPVEMNGKLAIQNGQVGITGLSLASGGNDVQLPVDIARVFEDKINEIVNFKKLGKNSLVITAERMKSSGNALSVEGHATLTRLQFGS